MEIYNSNGTLIADIVPDDSSYHIEALMGDNHIMLYFSSATHIDIPVGSYVQFSGNRYTVLYPEGIKIQHRTFFEYTVQFHAQQGLLDMWTFRNYVDKRTKFSLTATAQEHLQYLVADLNRRTNATVTIGVQTYDYGTGITWSGSSGIDTREKLISYDNLTCRQALELIAETFETEYVVRGTSIILEKIEVNKESPYPFSYGKGNGFRSGVTRTNANSLPPIDMLLVEGGNTNIDKSTYGNSTLLLPAHQQIGFDGTYFEDEEGYDSSAAYHYLALDGMTILNPNVQISEQRVETSINCSDIYPKRVGTVSAVHTINASTHLYSIDDSSIPSSLNYSNYVLAGETMTIIFQSGNLAGREFEVAYNHTNRRFSLVPIEEDGMTLPAAGGYLPAVGDTYAVFHCSLPQAYIRNDATKTGASWDMMREAIRQMHELQMQQYTFTGEVDPIFLYDHRLPQTQPPRPGYWQVVLSIGRYISFTDTSVQAQPMLMRVTSIKTKVNSIYEKEISMSVAVVRRTRTKITLNSVSGKIEDNMHLFKKEHKGTTRSFRSVFGDIDTLGSGLTTTNTNLSELQGRVGTFIPDNSTVNIGGKLLYSNGNLIITNTQHRGTLLSYKTCTEAYTLKNNDRLIIVKGNIKLGLPDDPIDGLVYDFKNITNSEARIQSDNADNPIVREDGTQAQYVPLGQYKMMSLVFIHGTGWVIMNN